MNPPADSGLVRRDRCFVEKQKYTWSLTIHDVMLLWSLVGLNSMELQ